MSTGENMVLNDEVVKLMRQCGHYLHHSAGKGTDNAKLLSVLNEDEKEALKTILGKCIQEWKQNTPTKPAEVVQS